MNFIVRGLPRARPWGEPRLGGLRAPEDRPIATASPGTHGAPRRSASPSALTQYLVFPARSAYKMLMEHKCAVCGKTDADCPDMEFRYCSKCNGYYCYCADHIYNHVHID